MKWRLAPALLVLAFGLALGARSVPGAEAHAFLTRSTPKESEVLPVGQSPPEVILWFTEGIEVNYSSAYVIDTNQERWEIPNQGAFHIHTDPTNPGLIMKPNMPNGTYTVVWDVISAVDGHRTRGAFAFFVGTPPLTPYTPPTTTADASSAPAEWLQVLTRWLNFGAMAALIGAVSFPFLVLPAGIERLKASPSKAGAVKRALRIARISTMVAAVALVVVSVMAIWVQAWLASGDSTSLQAVRDYINDSRYGDIWLARMALVAGSVVCSILILVRSKGEWHESITHPSNTPWAILAALAIALPITTSLNSHAAAGGNFDFQTAVDYLHLVSGGLWLGLLLQFLLVVLLVVPRVEERAGFLAGSVRRFSWIAVPAVTVIVITGVIQSIDRLGGISELWDSSYGVTLAVKVALLAPILVIAAFNLLVFGPRFIRIAHQRAQAMLRLRPWEGAFRTAVVLELSLAIAVLGVTAILTNSSPPGSAQSTGPSASTAANVAPTPSQDSGFALVDDLSLSVWAEPAKAGPTSINVLVIDQNGDEKTIQKVILRFKYLDKDLGVSQAEALDLHPPTHWVADTTDLSLPGKWQVQVIVRREGVLDSQGTVQLTINA